MDTASVARQLTEWITQQVEAAHMRGVIFGLSGGIDSAVIAGLAMRAFPNSSLGVIMPCHSNPEDREHALMVAKAFALKIVDVDLSAVYDTLLQAAAHATAGLEVSRLGLANVKPRLRMTTLYYFANVHSYLVLGTGNLSEYTIGYFTKHGDGGVDLMPIAGLVKAQIRDLAAYLGVPQLIIDKSPSAGLWANQTDEAEMGMSYQQLDKYILTGEAEPKVKERVDRLAALSAHKKQLPPIPKLEGCSR
ncbi:MAG: NAD+ synthetase [Bacillota bacterium]|nr:MAG: NAD+ synthetase [Bacillota bacterium]MBS3951088.1 NAD(+) synthase [Peptococcaceae bacterium]